MFEIETDTNSDYCGTVVLTSSIYWNFTWQRHQQMATQFAKRGYKVYFVHPLAGRWWTGSNNMMRRITNKITNPSGSLHSQMEHPLPEGIEIVRPAGIPDKFWPAQQYNKRVAVHRLADDLKRQGLPRPLICLNYVPLPYALALQAELDPDVMIYDAVYDFKRVPGSENGAWIEPEIAAAADLVFADSPYHLSRMLALGGNATEILPAADVALFEQAKSTSSPEHEKPLCAYFGTISETNQDLDLLREVSNRYPLRLIGPADEDFEGFDARTEWCGPVLYTDIPGLLEDVDVLLLPYAQQEHIEGVIPAKTFECLATGKPTVVTGLPSLDRYGDYFYLCSNHEEFLASIEKAFRECDGLANQRVALARENTWDQRIDQIIDRINQSLACQNEQ